MITTPIFTRLLSTDEFGRYNVFNSWYGILTILISLYLSAGVYQQGLIKYNNDRPVFSSSLQGLTTILVLFWTIIYLIFTDFWNKLFSLTTVQMLAMLLMIWTTAVFNFWTNEKRVQYKYRALVTITLIVSIAKPLLGIILVYNSEDKVTARIMGLAIIELICYSGLYIVQMKRGKTFFSSKYWKYALLYNLPLVPHYLSQTVLNNSDRIMIQNMVGESEAGIYSLAYSVSSIMMLFNTALSQTIGPWLYQKIKEKKVKDMESVAYITLIIIATVNILLMVLGPEVVSIFAPKSYQNAVWIIPPVAMGALFLYSYDLFAKFAFYYEKTFFVMIISCLGAGVNVFLNLLFIPIFGYVSAGYTTLISYVFYASGHYIYMIYICKKYNDGIIPYDTKKLLLIAFVFVLLGIVVLCTYNYQIIRYSLLFFGLIILFLFRKKVIHVIKSLISLRKKSK